MERLGPGAGTLHLEFTDTDFIRRNDGLSLVTSIEAGLAAGGGVSVQSFFDVSNLEFNKTAQLASQDYTFAADGASVDAELFSFLPGVRPAQHVSFTLDVLLTGEPGTSSRGGTGLRIPDGGSMIAMVGLGIACLGAFGVRRKK